MASEAKGLIVATMQDEAMFKHIPFQAEFSNHFHYEPARCMPLDFEHGRSKDGRDILVTITGGLDMKNHEYDAKLEIALQTAYPFTNDYAVVKKHFFLDGGAMHAQNVEQAMALLYRLRDVLYRQFLLDNAMEFEVADLKRLEKMDA